MFLFIIKNITKNIDDIVKIKSGKMVETNAGGKINNK